MEFVGTSTIIALELLPAGKFIDPFGLWRSTFYIFFNILNANSFQLKKILMKNLFKIAN